MLGSLFLTGTSDEQRLSQPGMAYFAGTGPQGKICEDCKFRGYWRDSREHFDPDTGNTTRESYQYGGCAKFRELAGQHGPPISRKLRACKYFIEKGVHHGRY